MSAHGAVLGRRQRLGAIAQATADELAEWGDAPLYDLRPALEPLSRRATPSQ